MKVRFDALRVGLEMVRALRPIIEKLRRVDPKLSDEIRRAASSVVANLAEGNRRQGRDRLHFFRMSAGSASEIEGELLTSMALGYVEECEIEAPIELEDRIQAMIYRLTH